MDLTVGVILIAAFLGFAVAMFLERVSALLALPLMAMTFLFIAAVADVFQPAQVLQVFQETSLDEFGRPQTKRHTAMNASRYERWKEVRRAQEEALREKALLVAQSADHLQSMFDADSVVSGSRVEPSRLADAIRDICAAERQLDEKIRLQIAALPAYFAQPPDYGGQREVFQQQMADVSIGELLRPLITSYESGNSDFLPRAKEVVRIAQQRQERVLERHPPLQDGESIGFSLTSLMAYLYYYMIKVLRVGSLYLYRTILATLFGGMFAVYVKNLKIAERMVYWTAEFAGERPFSIALAVFLVTGAIFTSVGGLGTVIMLGAIILPILRSVGLGAVFSAGVYLIAIAMGGTLQPVSRRLWLDFYGVAATQLDGILWTVAGFYFACGVTWIFLGTRGKSLSNFLAVEIEGEEPKRDRLPARLMIAPLVPVVLVYFFAVEEISAFTISIVYIYICVCRRNDAVRVLSRSMIEGAQMVIPPVLLMIGIGMLLVSLFTAPVQGYLQPLLSALVPESRWGYIATFVLAAPLALYRGPLNVWGMGLAVSGTLLAMSSLPPAAILCAILSAGMLQSVCDPTNTANVWVAGFQGVSVNRILRSTILLVWGTSAVAVIYFALRFVE